MDEITEEIPQLEPEQSREEKVSIDDVSQKSSEPSKMSIKIPADGKRKLSIFSTDLPKRPSSDYQIQIKPFAVMAEMSFPEDHQKASGLDFGYQPGGKGTGPPVTLQNTYRMKPDRKFNACDAQKIMQRYLEVLNKVTNYDPLNSGEMVKMLSKGLLQKIKEMNYKRYKLVATVTIGEQKAQGIQISSRCTWDVDNDSWAAVTYQNNFIFCVARVYAIYQE